MSVLVQEMEVALDEEFLRRLLVFATTLAATADPGSSDAHLLMAPATGADGADTGIFDRAPVRWWQEGSPGSSEGSTASTRYFFDELQLNALCINLSFRRVPAAVDQSFSLISPVTLTLNALGMVAMSVERSPLRMSGLKLTQVLQTRTGLVSRIVRHYRNQGLQELYKVVFSLDMLGNPVGVINALGSGVKDFFVEPAKGLIKSPQVQSARDCMVGGEGAGAGAHTCACTLSPCVFPRAGLWARLGTRVIEPAQQHGARRGHGCYWDREQRVPRCGTDHAR